MARDPGHLKCHRDPSRVSPDRAAGTLPAARIDAQNRVAYRQEFSMIMAVGFFLRLFVLYRPSFR